MTLFDWVHDHAPPYRWLSHGIAWIAGDRCCDWYAGRQVKK